jgi:hypothetical protein
MATYQDLLPGMGAAAATNFAALVTTAGSHNKQRRSSMRRVVIGRRSTETVRSGSVLASRMLPSLSRVGR